MAFAPTTRFLVRGVRGAGIAALPAHAVRGFACPAAGGGVPRRSPSRLSASRVEELAMLTDHTTAPIEQAKALHPLFYVDEDYTQIEQSRVFGNSWFAAAHTAELSKPGDIKVVDVGSTSIILTRDKAMKIHAFYNACRHRGARVCHSNAQGVKQLVCPYHWWAYRLDGSLKATPPAVTPKERKENLGLKEVPGLEVFAGMVFLNQQTNPPPLRDCLGDLPSKLQRYDLDDLEYAGRKDYQIKGDWKLIAENFVDFYHINAVHPELAKFSRVDDHKPYQGSGQYVGFVTEPLTDCGGPGDSGNFNSFPRINKVETTAALFFHIFPNVSITIYPHSVYTLMTLPGAKAGTTKEQLTMLMAPGAQIAGEASEVYKKKKEDLLKFVCRINDEDVEAIENLQQGLYNCNLQDIKGEFLPKYDWPIYRFQNMVINAIHGRPTEALNMPNICKSFEQKVEQLEAKSANEPATGPAPHFESLSPQLDQAVAMA